VEIEFMDVFKELINSFFSATLPVKEQTASLSEIVVIFTSELVPYPNDY